MRTGGAGGARRSSTDQVLWTAVVVVVALGVLPFVLHASAVWQVFGLLTAVAVGVHAVRRVLTGR